MVGFCPKCGARAEPDGKKHDHFPVVSRCWTCGTRTTTYSEGWRIIWGCDGHREDVPPGLLMTDPGREG